MKAIVLTYANITKEEERLLQNTDVFKIACNWHAENLKPDIRLICDKDILDKVKSAGKQKIATLLEYYPNDERLEDYRFLPRRNSSLPSCVDYLIHHGYTDILLVANNQITNGKEISKGFQNNNKNMIEQLAKFVRIYKYSKDGVFTVPHVGIKEFLEMDEKSEYLPLTDEDKLLGLTKPKKKNLLEMFAFSDSYLYEVHTKGLDNKGIETGDLIKGFLPPASQQKILEGEEEIEYNGLVIRRITGIKPKD